MFYQDAFQQTHSFPSMEKLTVIDFANLGTYALHTVNYYDRAVELFRETFRLFSQSSDEAEFLKTFGSEIQEMGLNAAKLNNRALLQKQVMVGASHKALPFLVDEKTLKKKKKPSNGFQNKKLLIDSKSDLGLEYFFRRLCHKGRYFEDENSIISKCGYYHHFDPFLKVSSTVDVGSLHKSNCIRHLVVFFVIYLIQLPLYHIPFILTNKITGLG